MTIAILVTAVRPILSASSPPATDPSAPAIPMTRKPTKLADSTAPVRLLMAVKLA